MTIPTAGSHGGDGARVAAALGLRVDQVLDLSASLNPVAPDPRPVVARHVDAISRYPDPAVATEAIAAALGVDPALVLLTNGGAEAISLLGQVVGGRVVEPEFSLHPRGNDGALWRSDPHNPTGLLAAPGELADVWDEAFYPLASGRWSAGARPLVVGSLTKVFACPGLRLGYVLVSEDNGDVLAEVRRRQPAWSVNGLALAALPDLLAAADLPAWSQHITRLRAELTGLLAAHGLDPQPSDANFVLCASAAGLRERLAPAGVVVRDCTSFGLAGHARVAVPDDSGMARLADALVSTA